MARKPDSKILEQTASIDRDSYTPAYAQVASILQQSMAKGNLRPGDQLPSEAQICNHFDVSPMTVRRAINSLIDQGIVVAKQGRGTFVKQIAIGEATFHLLELQNLFSNQNNTTVQILEASILKADQRTARKLDIQIGERTVFIRRIINQDGVPILYHREHLIYDLTRPIVESELEVTALQHLFSGTGGSIMKHGDIRIDPTLVTEEEANFLRVQLPMATFCLQHVFYDFDNKPLSWGRFIGRPDILNFNTQVGILADAAGFCNFYSLFQHEYAQAPVT